MDSDLNMSWGHCFFILDVDFQRLSIWHACTGCHYSQDVKCGPTELCIQGMFVQCSISLAEWTPYFTAGLVTLSVNCYVYFKNSFSCLPPGLFFHCIICSPYDLSSTREGEMLMQLFLPSPLIVRSLWRAPGPLRHGDVHHLSIHCQKSLVPAWNLLELTLQF